MFSELSVSHSVHSPSRQIPRWTETPLDRDPSWTGTPLDRDPPGQRPPPVMTSSGSHEAGGMHTNGNAYLFRIYSRHGHYARECFLWGYVLCKRVDDFYSYSLIFVNTWMDKTE